MLDHTIDDLLHSKERTDGGSMSDYAGGNAERDAFFAALGRIFEEFRHVSKGYAICDLARLAESVGGDVENQVAISRADSERIIIEFSDDLPGLVPEDGECITYVLNIATDPPSWECIMYLTS